MNPPPFESNINPALTPPLLLIISAPSGAGKTTLCKKLLAEFPKLTLSISCTTRAPRGTEEHGKEYYFLDRPAFESKIKAEAFAEWALVHGNYYGTSKESIESSFEKGNSVLLDIDVQGTASLKAAYPTRSYSVFIAPPSMAILESRLRARGTDTEDTIQRRMANAAHEMAQAHLFDYQLVNHDLGASTSELINLTRKVLKSG